MYLSADHWFSLGTPASSINKPDFHDIQVDVNSTTVLHDRGHGMSLKNQRSLKERFEDNKGVNKSRGIVDFIFIRFSLGTPASSINKPDFHDIHVT
jgi:hypothetical protein